MKRGLAISLAKVARADYSASGFSGGLVNGFGAENLLLQTIVQSRKTLAMRSTLQSTKMRFKVSRKLGLSALLKGRRKAQTGRVCVGRRGAVGKSVASCDELR